MSGEILPQSRERDTQGEQVRMRTDWRELRWWAGVTLGAAVGIPYMLFAGLYPITPQTVAGWIVLSASGIVILLSVAILAVPINWVERQFRSPILCKLLVTVLVFAYLAVLVWLVFTYYPNFIAENFAFKRH